MKKLIVFSVFLLFSAMPVKAVLFPTEGMDVLDGKAYLEVDLESGGFLFVNMDGPTEVYRSDPYPCPDGTGYDECIDTEIVSMSLTGTATGDSGPMPVEMQLQSDKTSQGKTIDMNPDPGDSYPAFSFFDIFFELTITTPSGPLKVKNEEPLHMDTIIDRIPPDLSETPYLGVVPIPLFDAATGNYVGDLTYAIHSPEPATAILLSLGGLALRFRKR